MSVWCEKCKKTTFNEKKCDHCGQNPKKEVKTYQVPKNNGVRMINNAGLDNDTITLSKNKIIIVAVVMIAISVSYLAINKYEENKQMSKISKIFFGTDDPDKIINMVEKQNIQSQKMLKDMQRQSEEMIRQQQKQMQSIFKK